MKKMILAAALIAGLAISGSSFAKLPCATSADATTTNCKQMKIAVVEVAKVVDKSAQVQALRKEQQEKLADLQKWLETVRADVAKQQTQEGQEKLLKKYNDQFAKRQENVKKEYAKKLAEIDKTISMAIAQQAKAQGYDMVFAKGIVLYGGDDITDSVVKVVK